MNQTIIFIAGFMCAGKTTLAKIIAHIARGQGLLVEQLKFAAPIYAMQELAYRLAGQAPVKNRGLLQAIGDACRMNLGTDYYEKVMEAAIGRSKADVIIVDDVRFAGEVVLARKLGAKTVWVDAHHATRKRRGEVLGTWSESKHNTEQGLPYDSFDQIVHNHGDLERLQHAALKLWTHLRAGEVLSCEPCSPTCSGEAEASIGNRVAEHVRVIDVLLQKHYGVTINDTGLEEDAAQDVTDGIRPYEVVNSWAANYDMGRIDLPGNWGLPVHKDLTLQDEQLAAVCPDCPQPYNAMLACALEGKVCYEEAA